MNSSAVGEVPEILLANCWEFWPQWECMAANIAGLISAGLWFIVPVFQVLKNFYRRSVSGLSFIWAVANFTASLVNLFFVFSIELPLYSRLSAVYMPIIELLILGQFMVFSKKPFTTRLLALLVCLLLWGGIIELELNLPEARDKVQWIAIILWCIETFPQIILNMKLQSTEGQATISVIIATIGKTTDFFVNYGLNIPLQFVVMCYFSSSSSFINGFQVAWYGEWFSKQRAPSFNNGVQDESTKLLSEKINDSIQYNHPSVVGSSKWRYWLYCVAVFRIICMVYVVIGLIVFAVAFFIRTSSFASLLGPLSCLFIVLCSNEYYRLKQSKRCAIF